MTYAGIAQREHLATRQEADGSTPSPRSISGPWALTELQAAAREAAVARRFIDTARRCLHADMPDEQILYVLACRGYDVLELAAIVPLALRELGHAG